MFTVHSTSTNDMPYSKLKHRTTINKKTADSVAES